MAKHSVTTFAKALAQTLSKKDVNEDVVVKNFAELLINSGYAHKANEILELAKDIMLQDQGFAKITLETARPMTKAQRTQMEKMAKRGDVIEEKINPELIAGVKITVNGQKQLDNSLLGKLNNF